MYYTTPHSTTIRRYGVPLLQAVLQVLAALKAAIQGHCTNRAQASGITNAVLVAWLRNMSPSQQTQTFRPQLMQAISQADLTPTGAVQVSVACTIQDYTAIEQCCFGVQRCLKHCNMKSSVDVLQNRFMFTTPFTSCVCIVALSDCT